jgi:hypothetical protein
MTPSSVVEFNVDSASGDMRLDSVTCDSLSQGSPSKTQLCCSKSESDCASTAETIRSAVMAELDDIQDNKGPAAERLAAGKLYHKQLFLRGEQIIAKMEAEMGISAPKEEAPKPSDWLSQGLNAKQTKETHRV